MPNIKLDNLEIYANTTKTTTPSIKLTKEDEILYCPLFEGVSKDAFLHGKDLVVSRLPLKIVSETGTILEPVKLEEILDTAPKATLYYKAGYNQQTRSDERYTTHYGSYGSSWREYYYVTQYRRQTIAYLKLASNVTTTNKLVTTTITSAVCNGVNVLNTYGSPSNSWTGWYDSAPGYPAYTEGHAITITYDVKLGNIVVKTGKINLAVSVPINSGTERNTKLAMAL